MKTQLIFLILFFLFITATCWSIIFTASVFSASTTLNQITYSNRSLSITPENQSVLYTAGTFDITVSSDGSWSVNDDASWITYTPHSGSNNGTVQVSYEQNSTLSTRIGTITFSGSGDEQALCIVTQSTSLQAPTLLLPANNAPGLSTAIANYPIVFSWNSVSGATSYDIQLADNIDFTNPVSANITDVSCYANNLDMDPHSQYYWRVKANSATGSSGWSGTNSFWTWDRYEPNGSLSTYSDLNPTIGEPYHHTISDASIAYDCNNETIDLDFYAFDVPFEVTHATITLSDLPQNHDLYLYCQGDMYGSPNHLSMNPETTTEVINADIVQNAGYIDGKYIICVQNAYGTTNPTNSFYTLTVDLTPAEPQLSITPSIQSLGSFAGSFVIHVTSNIAWTVTEDASWLTCVPLTGTGNGQFSVSSILNTSSTPRTADITITAGTLTAICTVTQDGAIANDDEVAGVQLLNQIDLYPNPCRGTLKGLLHNPGSDKVILQLYSIKGEKVSEDTRSVIKGHDSVFDVDLDALPTGIYLLAAKVGNAKTITRKVLLIK